MERDNYEDTLILWVGIPTRSLGSAKYSLLHNVQSLRQGLNVFRERTGGVVKVYTCSCVAGFLSPRNLATFSVN